MTALDQAFIKAYSKDHAAYPSAASDKPRSATVSGPSPPRRHDPARAIEQSYHDGSLYRIEAASAATPSGAHLPAAHVARLAPLPPTSPRRGVRRSLLRLLAGQDQTPAASQEAAEPAPRVSRKVIFRHIGHSLVPAPRGQLTSPPEPAQQEILPVADESVTYSAPTVETTPASAAEFVTPPQVQIHIDAPHPVASHRPHLNFAAPKQPPGPTVSQAPEPVPIAEAAKTAQPVTATERAAPAEVVAANEVTVVAEAVDPPPATVAVESASPAPASEEISLAESLEEPLSSDMIPQEDHEAEITLAPSAHEESRFEFSRAAAAPSPKAASATSQWEVDQFYWPKTCQKLLADGNGYLAQAGFRLLAAVKDGLKVLAITGSRRGEGRTTLSLCLARAAAGAGVQVAVLDGDFARPQLASKLGLEITSGWSDAAVGRIPLSEAAVKSLADNITALPLDPSSARQAFSFKDPRITATLRAAAATFDLLIVDLGPLGAGEEFAFPLGERCPFDAAIVVRDARFATVLESENIGRKLQESGVDAVGIAENFVVAEG